jgi:hypothetical protein
MKSAGPVKIASIPISGLLVAQLTTNADWLESYRVGTSLPSLYHG